MDALPVEILSQILGHLDFQTKCKAREVCSTWNEAIKLLMRSMRVIYIDEGSYDLAKLAPWMDNQQLKSYAQTNLNTIHCNPRYRTLPIDRLVSFIGKMCPRLEGLMTERAVTLSVLAESLGPRLIFFTARRQWEDRWSTSLASKFTSLAQFPGPSSNPGPCPLTSIENKVPLRIIRIPCSHECQRCRNITQVDVENFPPNLFALEWRFYEIDNKHSELDFSRYCTSLRVLDFNPQTFSFKTNFTHLKSLTIGDIGDNIDTKNKVVKLISSSPLLEHIFLVFDDIEDCNNNLMKIVPNLNNLKSLRYGARNSWGSYDLPDRFYETLIACCPLLEEFDSPLRIDENDALFFAEFRHLKKLQLLHISKEALFAFLTSLYPDGPKQLTINIRTRHVGAMTEEVHDVIRDHAETGRLEKITMDFWDYGHGCEDEDCPAKRIIRVPAIVRPFPCLLRPVQWSDLHDDVDVSTDFLWS